MNLYYVSIKGQPVGPINEAELQSEAAAGQYAAGTLIWREGMTGWEPIEQHFKLPAAPPPLPEDEPPPLPTQKTVNLDDLGKKIKNAAENINKFGKNVGDIAGQATGLEKLDGFSFKQFCKELFRRHTLDEVLDLFCCGTPRTTPDLKEINASWPAPWIFSRMLCFFLILYVGFNYALAQWHNLNLIPGLIFIGCFAMPFCVSIFFFETNVKRDMPFFEIIKCFLLGGVFSLFAALLFFEHGSLFSGAWWAGFMEEPAKLLVALLIVSPMYRRGNVLHGMAVGCAVGAGFAAFESAGYVYRYLGMYTDLIMAYELGGSADIVKWTALKHGITFNMTYEQFANNPAGSIRLLQEQVNPDAVLIQRAILTPFCHVVWSAITVGAFYHVMTKRAQEPGRKTWCIDITALGDKFSFGLYKFATIFTSQKDDLADNKLNMFIFCDYRFLSLFFCAIALHAVWNSPLLEGLGIFKLLGIGIVGWLIALLLLQIGIHQIRKEKEALLNQSEIEEEPAQES